MVCGFFVPKDGCKRPLTSSKEEDTSSGKVGREAKTLLAEEDKNGEVSPIAELQCQRKGNHTNPPMGKACFVCTADGGI
jgi:hypothetical protein